MSRYDVMLSYVPLYYHTSRIFKSVLKAEGRELDTLRDRTEELLDQLFADTATWGLELWEKEYGLSTSPQLSYEDRRARLKAKMRGVQKVTPAMIKSVAEAYSNGEVEVSFDGRIRIRFVGERGIPAELGLLKKQLDDIVQAHLEIVYEYTYLLWREFDVLTAGVQESMTWKQLEAYRPFLKEKPNLTWDEFDLIIPGVQESMTWDEMEIFEP
ncbi:uncharacterized protein DUF2313 [Anaerobacterium chartisolvens]|uniref:Uncharacterized protein DUF2313 n=1 Tax=Anaerobacterium chartisolvens TaxID=1297424 RepID=A0A369AVP3_9FIRM|nr:putative phage tail protein [Anaerobacterium chartisolvens]RCX13271.1 uncharacterized protein DUF2313 [Anaerobacterium chartisolvens]